ncbi:lipoprotein NlpD [Mesocricetibacter intestinalis]|uniref:Lipoprotein NlpD n=1 Tax=Mesocricetibacter intestinalis TaxID=1521930 RepID=A0A4R6VA00_9PAST|nr:murein hydrolase activator NlpD [Mesocricetibacter intestinalis]TDQ56671.1 lipoprotein NlpD [Mesocricetibacter intestinalis]
MKKSFLLLPVTVAVLSACSSSAPAPVESADGNLTPGIMQPVDNPSASGGSWEPQVQQSSMPAGMNNTVSLPNHNVSAPVQPQLQTAAQPVQQQVAQKAVTSSRSVNQNFEIPRNPQTNAPDYSKIDKGFYKGETYTVRKGDTMFLIAYISGMDVKALAALNNMSEPYNLHVGQVIKVSQGSAQNMPATTPAPLPAATQTAKSATVQPTQPAAQPEVTYTNGPNGTRYGSDGTITGPIKAGTGSAPAAVGAVGGAVTAGTAAGTVPVAAVSNIRWQWPAEGRIVQGFSNSDGGNKGIDIGGSKGQAVYAAAAGRVVYAGNALRGYGNLIIIKHDDDFLSAYAHNDSISVRDQQEVRAGQQIAKMGNSGTNSVKLHFEIRYRGKSVDPMRYLPKR